MTMLQLIFLCAILHMVYYAVSNPATSYVYSYEEDALFRLHIIPAVWSDAALRCQLEGGVLASPTSRGMAQAMLSTMEIHELASSVFIGTTGILSKGDFKSLDGTDLAKTSLEWAAGEPNNANNAEDCLAMTEVGALEDVSCSSLLPYFCRKESTKKCRVTHVKSLCKSHGYKWESGAGSCYKFHGAAKTWRFALATCHSEGGHLAIINNGNESELLKEIYKEHVANIDGAKESRHALIGFRRWDDGEWATIHGESLGKAGFGKWSWGEPNNSGEEKCGSIHDNGLLNDAPCDEPFAFICEITP